jgi:GT2 family glycosyltransferase/nucleoside-diphosphate-sugar epimerase
MKKTSVIIVSYYTGLPLRLCVASAIAHNNVAEIIIVNNGNTTADERWLEELSHNHANIRLISGHGNVGFGKAVNIAARNAVGDYLLVLNPDAVMLPSCIDAMINAMEETPEAWVAGANITDYRGRSVPQTARNILTPENAISSALFLPFFTESAPELNIYTPFTDEIMDIPAISGAFMFFRKSAFQQLNGFDESYFLHVEDMDICLRVNKMGGRIILVPTVKVLHFQGSSGGSSLKVELHKARSFAIYFTRHFPDTARYKQQFLKAMAFIRAYVKSAIGFIGKRLEIFSAEQREIRKLGILMNSAPNPLPREERVYLTGSTRLLGLCTLSRLLSAGYSVTAGHNSSAMFYGHPNLEWAKHDMESGLIPSAAADILIHAAPLWFLPPNIAHFAKCGVRRIIAFSSTSAESKVDAQNPFEMERAERLNSAEDSLKQKCAELGINLTIFRPTLIHGYGLDSNVTAIAKFIKLMRFFPIVGEASGLRQPVLADDLADAVLAVIHNHQTFGKTYNLSGGETLSYKEMVEHIFRANDIKPRFLRVNFLPKILDFLGKTLKRPRLNGDIARRMNKDLVYNYSPASQHFEYAPHGFLR